MSRHCAMLFFRSNVYVCVRDFLLDFGHDKVATWQQISLLLAQCYFMTALSEFRFEFFWKHFGNPLNNLVKFTLQSLKFHSKAKCCRFDIVKCMHNTDEGPFKMWCNMKFIGHLMRPSIFWNLAFVLLMSFATLKSIFRVIWWLRNLEQRIMGIYSVTHLHSLSVYQPISDPIKTK